VKVTEEINKKYAALSPEERVRSLYSEYSNILVTSSFGTTSAVLLHLISTINPKQKIIFLDTTYHFAETLSYKNQLMELLSLDVETVRPEEWKNNFTNSDQTWSKDPDLCCSINKVEPLDRVKHGHDIWISGLMKNQNAHRQQLNVFEQKSDIVKFYPIIDFSEQDAAVYMKKYELPQHPLLRHGFSSVGCIHCTVKGRGREGRWVNRSKTECGLHI
jgi:phosphoadenosine phosphosulfate reductase